MQMKYYSLILLLSVLSFSSVAQKELQISYQVKNGCTPEDYKINSLLRANCKNVMYKESTSDLQGKRGEEKKREIPLYHFFKDLISKTIWAKG